uniref:AT3g11590/F24K9_26 n=1 Tax=Arabidopsis thaliana TaxID=3702 RepID=Q945L6_ARATH|nr:AT3g11590/F24K9_26 [Arabidopsis thaliana]
MPRQNQSVENLLLLGKIRKRGCSSPTSSTSSILREGYRFKRAIVVGKRGGSTTPVPTWRLMGRSPSPRASGALHAAASPSSHCGSKTGKVSAPAPVSARKLAATLWEMNEMPSPRVVEEAAPMIRKSRKERIAPLPPPRSSVHSGSLPPHLSDPSHSPVSERMERSGTGSRQRRASSTVQKLRLGDCNVGARDPINSGSFMDIETRSRVETPTGSTVGVKTRLKDCSNALTTSKELLKIINRMWGQDDRPSSSMSLVSALHSELERARLQVNQLIHEHKPENNDISYLMKRFAEEKAVWKSNEQEVVEAAIESVAGELEVERKLRRRFESLNKKLGKELAETKSALMKAVKEIENEKRARVMVEKVCDELARDISEDKAEVEELKRESFKVKEEVEKEREMLQLADALREERVQMKLSEAKHQLEEKNAAVDKLRNQLQTYLKTKRCKEKTREPPQTQLHNEEAGDYLNHHISFGSYNIEDGEVENGNEEGSGESDLHSIELNIDNKSYKWPYGEENRGRKSTPRKSLSLQRSISDCVDWVVQSEKLQKSGDGGLDWGRSIDVEPKGYIDETQAYKPNKASSKDHHILSGSRLSNFRGGSVSKSRLSDASKGENQNARKSRW